ncbi:MAG: phosphotransferase family protein [Ilumatobacter sp.]|nr:phosphotransferase family protein [Ilumatobacter sp.]
MANAADGELIEQTLEVLLAASEVSAVELMTGGASRDTWRAVADGTAVVVQRQQVEAQRDMTVEAALLRAAEQVGVPAPRLLACGDGPDGVLCLVTEFVAGETIARRILRDERFEVARSRLTAQVGRAMARVHRIDASSTSGLAPIDELGLYRGQLDESGEPHPAFELGLRWLERHRPATDTESTRVVHGDFRLGNLIVDDGGLAAVIDWELAHLGHPLEDLGWACVPAWRFGSSLPAAGVGSREELLAAYNDEAGTEFSVDELRWWEVYGILRWGVMCLTQARRHLSGTTRSHELAAIGRRVCENEHDLLLTLEGHW